MNLSKTDTKELIRILEEASKIISTSAYSTKNANLARKCRLLRKKILKKNELCYMRLN